MKIIKYNLCTKVNLGTEETPVWKEILSPVEMGWNEANEKIVKKEAYNGEYTIEDDGFVEPVAKPSLEERTQALEEALNLLLEGATE